jgi:hypothetical protein
MITHRGCFIRPDPKVLTTCKTQSHWLSNTELVQLHIIATTNIAFATVVAAFAITTTTTTTTIITTTTTTIKKQVQSSVI